MAAVDVGTALHECTMKTIELKIDQKTDQTNDYFATFGSEMSDFHGVFKILFTSVLRTESEFQL